MQIIIVGAGLTGTQLARRLVQEKHDVSIIESNEERARHTSNRIDCMVLHDEGNSLSALEEAGIAKAEALVCVTDSDEVNMIICGLAASRYPGLLKMARVRNDDYIRLNQYSSNSKVMGIDCFVHPDVEAARAIIRSFSHGALGNVFDFAGTSYGLGSITVAKGSAFDGLCLKDYHSVVKEESLVVFIERENGTSGKYMLPQGSTIIKKEDRVHILAREEHLERIFGFAGRHEKPLRNIGIIGGGRIGALIAEGILGTIPGNPAPEDKRKMREKKRFSLFSILRSLGKNSRSVTIIEQDYQVCKELAARFPEALVLNEDISDESFVAEEHLGELDLIITATANQELNIITAVYLKSRGVKRAIAIVNSSGYEAIARQLGVDVVISLQSVVVDSMLSALKNKGIREVHSLGEGDLEILEAEIQDESPVAEKAITDWRLSEGGLILLVSRGDASFIPKGDYIFKPEDKVVLMAKKGSEAELEKLFGIT